MHLLGLYVILGRAVVEIKVPVIIALNYKENRSSHQRTGTVSLFYELGEVKRPLYLAWSFLG